MEENIILSIEENELLNDLDNPITQKPTKEELKQQKEQLKQQKEELKLHKQMEKELIKQQKEEEKISKQLQKQKQTKEQTDDDDEIFSENGTELIGKEKRVLLIKVKQYKQLFLEELKTFKIKKNPTTEELKQAIEEMDNIISTKNIDNFLTESVLNIIKMVEPLSTYTRYNITGLCDILKSNKDFHKLTKQLFLKYNCYDNIPIEYQLCMIVSVSSFICIQKNQKKKEIEAFLNEDINN